MPDLDDENHEARLFDAIEDAIIPDAHPPEIAFAAELFRPWRSRIRLQRHDRAEDAAAGLVVERAEVFAHRPEVDGRGHCARSSRERPCSASTSSRGAEGEPSARHAASAARAASASARSSSSSRSSMSSIGTTATRGLPRRVKTTRSLPKAARLSSSENLSRAAPVERVPSRDMTSSNSKARKCTFRRKYMREGSACQVGGGFTLEGVVSIAEPRRAAAPRPRTRRQQPTGLHWRRREPATREANEESRP